MSYIYRFELFSNKYFIDDQLESEKKQIEWIESYLGYKVLNLWETKYFLVKSNAALDGEFAWIEEVLLDPVTQVLLIGSDISHAIKQDFLKLKKFHRPQIIDISFKPGVTDNTAHAVKEALLLNPRLKKYDLDVSSGLTLYLEGTNTFGAEELSKIAHEKYANSLLHNVLFSENKSFPEVIVEESRVSFFDVNQDDCYFEDLNQKNCWAFSRDEISQIKNYFKSLKRSPSDVEMEIIAQTWSEHCKHKIFAAEISYSENEEMPEHLIKLGALDIKGIFKTYIKGATETIVANRSLPWLVSVFHDNAGIVRFDENLDVCIKVETHNSPSALDPYGGALTGILGVNRDILGAGLGAQPIANTNVFCLAENSFFEKNQIAIPNLLKNPDRIKEGVHHGVQDGGNKSGIPTINGAFVYHESFVGKPLVFCGTVGVIPHKENEIIMSQKSQRPNDFIVMAGGRIGKDGIHGATFSSLELQGNTPSSVVQIGDPITQKRLSDFLIEARQKGLFSSVTDNGAGGLSSSIGEMAQATNGARVFLDKALVKYPGLSAYELMVSESQERMTFAVSEEKIDDFLRLAQNRNVEASVVGEFTSTGMLEVYFRNELVANLSLEFLHNSLRPMSLCANFQPSYQAKKWYSNKILKPELPKNNFKKILLDLLSSPNIKSHEDLIRRYDHEVKASTVVKPFTGHSEVAFSGPTDAGVLWLKPFGGESLNAIAVSSGICPKLSKYDTYTMAQFALDEAVRNAICVGANPDEMVLVDNFCWPDPIASSKTPDGEFKLAQLVRASKGLYDLAVSYGMPFVSGKDSMKNDFIGDGFNGESVKISVEPTVLVTALGRISDLKIVKTSEVKSSGDLLYVIGAAQADLAKGDYAFELAALYEGYDVHGTSSFFESSKQINIYRKFHKALKNQLIKSSHDVSDGGLLVAIAEKIFSTPWGVTLNFNHSIDQLMRVFFNESMGRIVVTVEKESQRNFEEIFDSSEITLIGETDDTSVLKVYSNKDLLFDVSNTECLGSYKSGKKDSYE